MPTVYRSVEEGLEFESGSLARPTAAQPGKPIVVASLAIDRRYEPPESVMDVTDVRPTQTVRSQPVQRQPDRAASAVPPSSSGLESSKAQEPVAPVDPSKPKSKSDDFDWIQEDEWSRLKTFMQGHQRKLDQEKGAVKQEEVQRTLEDSEPREERERVQEEITRRQELARRGQLPRAKVEYVSRAEKPKDVSEKPSRQPAAKPLQRKPEQTPSQTLSPETSTSDVSSQALPRDDVSQEEVETEGVERTPTETSQPVQIADSQSESSYQESSGKQSLADDSKSIERADPDSVSTISETIEDPQKTEEVIQREIEPRSKTTKPGEQQSAKTEPKSSLGDRIVAAAKSLFRGEERPESLPASKPEPALDEGISDAQVKEPETTPDFMATEESMAESEPEAIQRVPADDQLVSEEEKDSSAAQPGSPANLLEVKPSKRMADSPEAEDTPARIMGSESTKSPDRTVSASDIQTEDDAVEIASLPSEAVAGDDFAESGIDDQAIQYADQRAESSQEQGQQASDISRLDQPEPEDIVEERAPRVQPPTIERKETDRGSSPVRSDAEQQVEIAGDAEATIHGAEKQALEDSPIEPELQGFAESSSDVAATEPSAPPEPAERAETVELPGGEPAQETIPGDDEMTLIQRSVEPDEETESSSVSGRPPEAESLESKLPSQRLPLDAVWPVEKVEPPTIVPPPTKTTDPGSAQPTVQRKPAGDDEIANKLHQALKDVTPGQPTDSSIEIVPPRGPRPNMPTKQKPPVVDVQAEPTKSKDKTKEKKSVPSKPQSTVEVPQKEDAGTYMVPTEVGDLPSDFWEYLGEKPPPPPAEDQFSARTTQDVRPKDIQRYIHPAESPTIVTQEFPMSGVQREISTEVGRGSRSREGEEATQEEGSVEDEKEVDISELARQVLPEIKRRLMVDWERGRGRL